MIRQPISRPWQIGLGLTCVLLLVGTYAYLSYQRTVAAAAEGSENLTIPSFSQLGKSFVDLCQPQGRNKEIPLWQDSKVTFWRLFSGLGLSVALSVVIGMAMGVYAPAEAFFLPTLTFLAKIPPTAMLALFFVLVGTEYEMYVSMLIFGTLPTLAQAVYQAAKSDVPEELVFKAYTIGAHHAEVIYNVVFHQIFPRVLEAVRLTVGPAMVLLIAAEYSGGTGGGFGFRIRFYFNKVDMTYVYVYVLLLGAAGYAIDFALTWLRRKMCPWFEA